MIETTQYHLNKAANKEIKDPIKTADVIRTDFAGKLIGKVIAEMKGNKTGIDHEARIAKLAKQLSFYNGLVPDPIYKGRRLNVTRLIASLEK